jgi:chloride channel protein, CIC family
MREYAVDPLEATFVREVMDTDLYTFDPARPLAGAYDALPEGSAARRQRLYPVIDATAGLLGVLPWSAVLAGKDQPNLRVCDAMITSPSVARPDEVLRSVADRMAALGLGALPVVDPSRPQRLEGLVTQFDLLEARQKLLEEERHAERILTLRKVTAPKTDETDETEESPDGSAPR